MFTDAIDRTRRLLHGLGGPARVALVVLLCFYALALLAPVVAPYAPSQQLDIVALKNQPPSFAHWFGTDRVSRDVLTRTLYGARVSLSVATLAMLVAAVVGTTYGLVAGTLGGAVDTVMMRFLDALLAIPRVLLLIAILALWNPVPLSMLVLLLGLTGWFDVSRLVRAEAMAMREREFVVAARSLGARRGRIMLRHLLPNVLVPVIVTTTLGIGNVIVLEAGLSFIGIGVHEPTASWGTMFQEGTAAFAGTWWAALFPGIAIVVTVLCFNVLGDALRAVLDPRHLPRSRIAAPAATFAAVAE
ncbi:MAG TPA: ABC transporter permease [Gemmatimonadaceae bacterium]|nr:ABC transporter permease [Gemmatimonadaceae bacterium]